MSPNITINSTRHKHSLCTNVKFVVDIRMSQNDVNFQFWDKLYSIVTVQINQNKITKFICALNKVGTTYTVQ